MMRSRSLISSILILACITGCADPAETEARGVEELARHRDDRLLLAIPKGLRLVSSEDRGAYVDSGPLLQIPMPTTFDRDFTTEEVVGSSILESFDAQLRAAGASVVSRRCNISIRQQTWMWSARSEGDDVSVSVALSPTGPGAPVHMRLSVQRSTEEPDRGLDDCLTRELPADAFTSPWKDRPRSREELCDVLDDDVRRKVFGERSQFKATACSASGRRGRARTWVQVGDARAQSLAQLLDNVLPGTDPNAARFEDLTGLTKFIVLPRLRSGALVVSSDRVDVVRTAADAIERADR